MVSVSLDAMSLVMSSLDDGHFAALKESSGVTLLWRPSLWLVSSLTRNPPPRGAGPSAQDVALWRRRHRAALARLRSAGIAVVADEERGFGRYVDLRSRWDGLVHALAPGLAFSMEEVDLPATLAQKGP